jgi:molybdopterin/thiamine biosynthesis adenylyltransferase
MAESAPQAAVREKAISEDEAKLYDRQLRLWGAAAQARMLASNVLFAGRFRGIAVDAVKNVVLAGVGALTLLDGDDLEPEDLGANYFVTEHEIGQKVRSFPWADEAGAHPAAPPLSRSASKRRHLESAP